MSNMRGSGVRWLVGLGATTLLLSGCSSDSGGSAEDKQGPPSVDVQELLLTTEDLPEGFTVDSAESGSGEELSAQERDEMIQEAASEAEEMLSELGEINPPECAALYTQQANLLPNLMGQMAEGDLAIASIASKPEVTNVAEIVSTKPVTELNEQTREYLNTCGELKTTMSMDDGEKVTMTIKTEELDLPDLAGVDALAYQMVSSFEMPLVGDMTLPSFSGYAQIRGVSVFLNTATIAALGKDEFQEIFTAAVNKVRDAA